VLGAGERDVEQPQPLAGDLRERPLLVRLPRVVGAGTADVERPAGGVVEGQDRLVQPARRPQERREHDRVLQPLAAVHGEQLHGPVVGLEPAGPLVGWDLLGVGLRDRLREPRRQRRRAELLVDRRPVQQLPDVVEVGEVPLPADDPEQPRGQVGRDRDRAQQRGHPPFAQHLGPAVELVVEVGEVVVGRGGELLAAPAEEAREGRGARPRAVGRLLEGLQELLPLAGGGGLEHAADAVDDRRHPHLAERPVDLHGLRVGAHQDGEVAGRDRQLAPAAPDGRVRGEQLDRLRGDVGGDVLPRRRGVDVALPGAQVVRARDAAQPQRCAGAGEPRSTWSSAGSTSR
jgi:hypothetical protein